MSETREDLGIKTVELFRQEMPDGTIRRLEASSAYDLRAHPRNYGIHCMDLVWSIRRGNVGVTWRLFSGWYLAQNREVLQNALAVDGLGSIDYHSPVPTYEGQSATSHDCEITGGDCYADGSGLASSELFEKFLRDPAQVWIGLEDWLTDVEAKVQAEQANARSFS